MTNWDDLRFLLAVYRAGTMSAAARQLGTNVATVSRRVDRLATELGEPPFIKSSNGWRPSPGVAGLLDAAAAFDRMVSREVDSDLRSVSDRLPSIRLGSPPMITSAILLPNLAHRTSPVERVDLQIVQRMFETGMGGHDVVIQVGPPESDRLVARKVGTLAFGVYRWRNGPSTDRWVGLTEEHEPFEPLDRARAIFRRPPCVRLENFDAVFQASRMLRLPAPLPEALARLDSGLQRIDAARPFATTEFWAVHHPGRLGDPAVEIVVDWIAAAFDAVLAAGGDQQLCG